MGGQAVNAIVSEPAVANNTPMMRQYLETKALHPDCILFFRLRKRLRTSSAPRGCRDSFVWFDPGRVWRRP